MKKLHIDIETYSSKDIGKCGLYNYVQSDDFQILLFAYAFDDEDVKIIDLAQKEQLPQELITALFDKDIIKIAYNAAFEWYCLNKFYYSPIDQWQCTMVKGLYCGYPAGLAAIGNAIGLAEDKKKLTTGKALIRYFCVPCRPTRTNGGRTRNFAHHDLAKWNLFKEYCVQDVVTEREIEKKLESVQFPQSEQEMWIIDQKMNAYGVMIDKKLVDGAKKAVNKAGQLLEKSFNDSGDKSDDKIESLESRAEYARELSKSLASDRKAQSLEQEIPHAPMSR